MYPTPCAITRDVPCGSPPSPPPLQDQWSSLPTDNVILQCHIAVSTIKNVQPRHPTFDRCAFLNHCMLVTRVLHLPTGWRCLTVAVQTPYPTCTAQARMTPTMSASGERCCPERRFPLNLKLERNSGIGTVSDASPLCSYRD